MLSLFSLECDESFYLMMATRNPQFQVIIFSKCAVGKGHFWAHNYSNYVALNAYFIMSIIKYHSFPCDDTDGINIHGASYLKSAVCL